MDLLAELTGRIIPKTSTPGAVEAGVPALIEEAVRDNPARQKRWKDLLAWVAREGGPTPASRLALLEKASQENGTSAARHFEVLKGETIDLYYSTREGLQQELGWNANTFLSEFKGCTHPEHKG